MLRLQYKIIISLWVKLFDERAALSLAAMLDQGTKIGAPSPEIIIHINHGNCGRFGSSLQSCNAVSQGWNETGQLFRLGEIEIVNYVHKDQADLRLVGRLPCRSAFLRRKDFRGVACGIDRWQPSINRA